MNASNRIKHFIIENTAYLLDFLSNELKLQKDLARDLLALGAVYINKVRTVDNVLVQPNDYIRLHIEPKRYDFTKINLKSKIIFENSDFIILNKPAGYPVHPTLDNIKENIITQLSLTLNQTLYPTHRLDLPTSGLLLLAKTVSFQRHFNFLLTDRKVKKHYLANLEGYFQIKEKLLIHYMEKSDRAPRKLFSEPARDRMKCELEILCYTDFSKESNKFSEVKINLLTGRTHQIRAQMALMGHPIINDIMYGAKKILDEDKIYLHCCYLEFESPSEERFKFENITDFKN